MTCAASVEGVVVNENRAKDGALGFEIVRKRTFSCRDRIGHRDVAGKKRECNTATPLGFALTRIESSAHARSDYRLAVATPPEDIRLHADRDGLSDALRADRSVWVGRLGTDAVAAVAVSGNLMFLVVAATQMLGVGTTTSKSPYLAGLIEEFAPRLNVVNVGCDGLENAIEMGEVRNRTTTALLERHLAPVKDSDADVVRSGLHPLPVPA